MGPKNEAKEAPARKKWGKHSKDTISAKAQLAIFALMRGILLCGAGYLGLHFFMYFIGIGQTAQWSPWEPPPLPSANNIPFVSNLLSHLLRISMPFWAKRSLPLEKGMIQVAGLKESISIQRDSFGAPIVNAKSNLDMLFGQGFVHAQDRLWQMEVLRRSATGQQSAAFGPSFIASDEVVHTLGIAARAKIELDIMDAKTLKMIEAYVGGINAFLLDPTHYLPPEFYIVGLKQITPWTPLDVIAIARLLTWQQTKGWERETVSTMLSHDEEMIAKEFGLWTPAIANITMKKGASAKTFETFMPAASASTAFAVNGSKMLNEQSLLMIELHSSPSLPSLWYKVTMANGNQQVWSGLSIPGQPFLFHGHSSTLGWSTIPSSKASSRLVAVATDKKGNPLCVKEKTSAREVHGPCPVRSSRIAINGQAPMEVQTIETDHGPIISHAMKVNGQPVAVEAAAFREQSFLQGLKGIMFADTPDKLRKAVSTVTAPIWDVVFVAANGQVGSFDSSSIDLETKRNYSIDAFSFAANGANCARATSKETDLNVLTKDSRGLCTRSRRLSFLLQQITAREEIDISHLVNIMYDVFSEPAYQLVRFVLNHEQERVDRDTITGPADFAIKYLRKWDGFFHARSVGATFAATLVREMSESLISNIRAVDEVVDLIRGWAGSGVLSEFPLGSASRILRVVTNEDSLLMSRMGGLDRFIVGSLNSTGIWIAKNLGIEEHNLRWGEVHRVVFAHPLSKLGSLRRVFSVTDVPIGGYFDTVMMTPPSNDARWDAATLAPAARMIVSTSERHGLQSTVSIFPGQSGHPLSSHYQDTISDLIENKFRPTELKNEDELIIVPKETENSKI